MKFTYFAVIILMVAFATPALAQITGAGGTGSLGGTSTNGIGGSIGAPAGSLNNGPASVAPSSAGTTVNPGGQITPQTQQQQQTTTVPNYINPSSINPNMPNTTAPGLAPIQAP